MKNEHALDAHAGKQRDEQERSRGEKLLVFSVLRRILRSLMNGATSDRDIIIRGTALELRKGS